MVSLSLKSSFVYVHRRRKTVCMSSEKRTIAPLNILERRGRLLSTVSDKGAIRAAPAQFRHTSRELHKTCAYIAAI